MPEGHTIHRAAREQREILVGQTVRASSPQGRFTDAARLDRARLESIDAHGKHLFYSFRAPRSRALRILHVHLGLAGKFRWRASPPPEPRGAVRLRLVTTDKTLDLSGPLVCELIDEPMMESIRARLGPDPLIARTTATPFARRLATTRAAIGTTLLDQEIIAGLGNVYRAELLFLARIDPRRPSSALTPDEVRGLWDVARRLLRAGVDTGRIATIDVALPGAAKAVSLAVPSGRGRHRRTFVYKQRTCRVCSTAITSAKLAGRPCFYCPHCQR